MSSIIIIEGNIGVGKTTLTEMIASRYGYRAMREPVEENPYLKDFYADPAGHALEMQFWLMSRRFLMHEEAIRHVMTTGQGVVMDRSIYGDFVFALVNHEQGHITDKGFDNYMAMRSVMERMLYSPRHAIFLAASPETCLTRIKNRSRGCETGITVDYLTRLGAAYYLLLERLKARGVNVLQWDWNRFPSEPVMRAQCDEIIEPSFKRYPKLNSDLFYPTLEERLS